jgi:hypothetical protein
MIAGMKRKHRWSFFLLLVELQKSTSSFSMNFLQKAFG